MLLWLFASSDRNCRYSGKQSFPQSPALFHCLERFSGLGPGLWCSTCEVCPAQRFIGNRRALAVLVAQSIVVVQISQVRTHYQFEPTLECLCSELIDRATGYGLRLVELVYQATRHATQ